nr:hypothetical protein [Psychrobacter sp. HII-4]
MFNDDAGFELVNLQAQRDLNSLVKNDERRHNNRKERVDLNETIDIGGNRDETVHKSEQILIKGNRDKTVKGNDTLTVNKDRKETVNKSRSLTVDKTNTEFVKLGKSVTVGLGYATQVGTIMNTAVGIMQTEQVGRIKKTFVGKSYSITAGDEFKITVGKSSLVMNADGSIIITGSSIITQAEKENKVIGKDVLINPPGASAGGDREPYPENAGYMATYGEPDQGGGGLDGFGNYNPRNPNEHWDPDEQKMMPGKPPIIIDSNQAAVYQYFNGNGEAVELGATTKSRLRNHDRQKAALARLKSGVTDMDGFYRVDMTRGSNSMFHVGRTGVEYDTQCNNGICTTTFKGFQQKDKTTGRIYPDAFVDPIDIGIEVGGTPYDYKPYVWQEIYPDNFTGKK